jgi:Mg2+/citrate symporter
MSPIVGPTQLTQLGVDLKEFVVVEVKNAISNTEAAINTVTGDSGGPHFSLSNDSGLGLLGKLWKMFKENPSRFLIAAALVATTVACAVFAPIGVIVCVAALLTVALLLVFNAVLTALRVGDQPPESLPSGEPQAESTELGTSQLETGRSEKESNLKTTRSSSSESEEGDDDLL